MAGDSAFEQTYELKSQLGAGGYGSVKLARHLRLGRDVAIKFLSENLIDRPHERDRFLREARTLSSLSHPGLLKVLEAGQHGDALYIVMELAAGDTLSAVLEEQGKLEPAEAVKLTLQLLDVLDYLTSRGVTHRDIKPSNLFVGADSELKLGDFGIALDAATTERLTRTGCIVGTIAYLAPELLRGVDASPSTDLFAAGAVLYEMLCGKRVWGSLKSGAPVLPGAAKITPARALAPEVPDALSDLMERWLALEPEARPGPAEVRAELERAIAPPATGEVARARSSMPTPVSGAPSPARRRTGSGATRIPSQASPHTPVMTPARTGQWRVIAGVTAMIAVVLIGALVARWTRPRIPELPPSVRGSPTSSASPVPGVEVLSARLEATPLGGKLPAEVDRAAEAFMSGKAEVVREIATRKLAELTDDEQVMAELRESGDLLEPATAEERAAVQTFRLRVRSLQFVAWTRRVRLAGLLKRIEDPVFKLGTGSAFDIQSYAMLYREIRYDRAGLPRLRDALDAVTWSKDAVAAGGMPGWEVRVITRALQMIVRNHAAQEWEPPVRPEVDKLVAGWLARTRSASGDSSSARLGRSLALLLQLESGGSKQQRAEWSKLLTDELTVLQQASRLRDRPYYDRLLEPSPAPAR